MDDYFLLSALSLAILSAILEIIKKDTRIETDNFWFKALRFLTFLSFLGLIIWMIIFWFS
tara:strand:- start:47 stop:226 length:180 start_codon:yes stop_codon:yes gene_type:complete